MEYHLLLLKHRNTCRRAVTSQIAVSRSLGLYNYSSSPELTSGASFEGAGGGPSPLPPRKKNRKKEEKKEKREKKEKK